MTNLKKKYLIYALAGLCVMPQVALAADEDKEAVKPEVTVEAFRDKAEDKAEAKEEKKETKKVDSKKKETKTSAKEEKKPTVEKKSNIFKDEKDNKKTKVKVLEVQTGELLATATGDVDGDGVEEEINLMGSPIVSKSKFYGDIYLISKDKANGKIKGYLRPVDLGGYNPYLTLADVTGNGVDNILIVANTGGSGGIIDYRIADFSDKDGTKEIFTKENNKGIDMVGEFLPDYKAKLSFPSIKRNIEVDVSDNSSLYNHANVYTQEGDVKSSGIRPYVQDLSALSLLDIDNDGVEEVITTQRVVGATNSNTLANVITTWKYLAKTWQPQKIRFQTDLFEKENFNRDNNIIGESGYVINKVAVAVDNTNVSYPHFSKMGTGKQQWTLNSQIENFVSSEITSLEGQGSVDINYELKYLGKNYASFLFIGNKTIEGKDTTIKKAFNFNMRTGESIKLEDLVADTSDFWKIVEDTTKVEKDGKAVKVQKKDVKDFYFDGTAVTLIDKDDKEMELPLLLVGKTLEKNKLGEKILTTQSNGVNKSNPKKNEEK